MQPGNEPQQIYPHTENIPQGYEPPQICLHSGNVMQEAQEAFDDMVELILSKRKCVSVEGNYT